MQIILQKILPKHLLSKWLGSLARCRWVRFKNWAIRYFCWRFKVNMEESITSDITQFPSFNDFFIRQLKPTARPIDTNPFAIVSPVDGTIVELGQIEDTRLIQAKKNYYQLDELLGSDHSLTQMFSNGSFVTIYLAPKDYHRVHMPYQGRLLQMNYIPGRLFSVNPALVPYIPRLFAENERVVCVFDTAFGRMAVIFVGAFLIGSVVTSWHGQVMPCSGKKSLIKKYETDNITLQRGDELGYFQWGSTVIVLFAPHAICLENYLRTSSAVKMGEAIGTLLKCE